MEHAQQVVNENLRDGNTLQLTRLPSDTDERFFHKYLFAFWRGRVVTVVGQVASEDVELAGNHPPRVSHLQLILRR